MSEPRRLTKPSALEESAVGARRQSKVKYVYRLLRPGDVADSLASKTVYVLWPDDGTWYKGQVSDCDAASGKATIYYDETEETEECDLKELVQEGQIAFKEPRPVGHKCKSGEIEMDQRYYGRKAGDPAVADLEDSDAGGEEGSEDLVDAGALDDDSDSDVSFSSAELVGKKRKRGVDESDEEVELEEFEKKEIMRDMSDDEKPLGFRADELERKQKRQQQKAKRQQQPQAGAKAPAAPAAASAVLKAAATAAQPARRQRREAAAGVMAAVQAVAAVQAAAAADGSSDDEPPSARKFKQRQSVAGGQPGELDDDEAAAEAYACSLLARVTNKSLPGQQKDAFYGRQGSGGRELERRVSTGQSDDELRKKVRAGIRQALEVVAKEPAGEAGSLPDPPAVAEAVEAALFKLFGGVTKDYKAKFRTLQFNLKDPHNPDLRAHVLRGDITPDAFVRMTATELANKELAAYRKAKEEEALKMSVLDAEAAAKFSTAAALDARDKLAIPAAVMAEKMLAAREPTPERELPGGRSPSPAPASAVATAAVARTGADAAAPSPRDAATMLGQESGPLEKVEGRAADLHGEGGGLYRVSDSMDAELASRGAGEEYDPETAYADEGAKPEEAAATAPSAAALDWAAIKKAAAVAAGEKERQTSIVAPLLESLDSLKPAPQVTERGIEGHHKHQRHHHKHLSLLELPSPEQLDDQPLPSPAEPGSPTSLRNLILPAADPTYLFGKNVWEGQFVVPGTGAFQLSADGLAGSGDVAALLGDQEIEVKGRLAIQKLDHFVTELRHSRSRTVTLGLLSAAGDCSPDEQAALQELIMGQYTARGRCGVANPSRDVEAYLLPASKLSERLVTAARAAAPTQVEVLLPGGSNRIGPNQLLLAIIHRRDWRAPYGFARPVKRTRVHPAPGAAAAEPAAEKTAPAAAAAALPSPPAPPSAAPAAPQDGAAPEPVTTSAVALPEGLDLGAISALAAALGVAPAGAEPEHHRQQQHPPSPSLPGAGVVPQASTAPVQMDQLQQLLASLPPAPVGQEAAPGLPSAGSQLPDSRQRRSRWEGADEAAGAQQAGPSVPLQQQQLDSRTRRSRWEGDSQGSGAAEAEQQLTALAGQQLPPTSAGGLGPPAGPMGPMQRVGQLQPPQTLPLSQPPGTVGLPPLAPPQQFIPPASMPPSPPPLQGQYAPDAGYSLVPPSMPHQQQMQGAPPHFQQPGMAPSAPTGGFAPSGAPYQRPMGHEPPMSGTAQQAGPGAFAQGAPMYPLQQQFGGNRPPHGDVGRGRGRGSRFGGRFGGTGGRFGGRDGGRARGGRGGRQQY